ncbi:MAG: AAA family ATPase [Euryarchaeota archaeon]|nr:AAA family ATPase [Euryarchaeota archaeon]
MAPRRILAFVGLQASGKSEASHLAREMSIPVVVLGDVVREETRRRGRPESEAGDVARALRREEGMDAVAARAVARLRALSGPLAVVDGIRGAAEVERFRREFGGAFRLVRVEAGEEARFGRACRRERGDAPRSLEEFRERDRREEGFGIREAMGGAPLEVRNDGDLEGFRREIRELLEEQRGSAP